MVQAGLFAVLPPARRTNLLGSSWRVSGGRGGCFGSLQDMEMKSGVKLEHKHGTCPGAHRKRGWKNLSNPLLLGTPCFEGGLCSGVGARHLVSGTEGHEEVVVVGG